MKCHRVNSHIIIRCDTTLTDPPNKRCPDIRTVLELQPVLWTQSKPSENQGDVRRGKEEDFCDGDLVGFECAVRVDQIEIGVPHPRIGVRRTHDVLPLLYVGSDARLCGLRWA